MPCYGPWAGHSQKSWMEVSGPLPKTLKPIHEQNLWFLLPCIWPGQKFDSLFMSIAADTVMLNKLSYEGPLLMVLFIMMKKWLLLRNIVPNLKLVKITKTIPHLRPKWPKSMPYLWPKGWNTLPFGAAQTSIAHWGSHFPGVLASLSIEVLNFFPGKSILLQAQGQGHLKACFQNPNRLQLSY